MKDDGFKEVIEGLLKACDELMVEFVSKKRGADWEIINDAMVAGRKAIGQKRHEPKGGWKEIQERKITVGELIKLASDLKSEDGENPEYERALAELVTDAAGLSMDHKADVARRIGLKADVT